jgi:hypothetical protein
MSLSLTKFICWLLDYKSFKNASEPYNIPNDKLQKVMGITECILSVSRDVFIPFHLGFAANAFSILPGTPLVFGLLNAKQAVKDDAKNCC